jgi:hypothetical protein
MAARALLTLALTGCAVTFGDLPDASTSCDCREGDVCWEAGAIDPDDPCLECRPDRSTEALTDVCGAAVLETTFSDFADGTMPRSLGNVYVSADGALRVVESSDANGDGFPDLVFSNFIDDLSRYEQSSYVYFGSRGGFTLEARASLATSGAIGASSADLNADGHVDLVFSCHIDNRLSRDISSYIYWGGPMGFDAARRDELPTHGANGNTIADLNADGYLDIVFANQLLGPSWTASSYIYFGGPAGFREENRAELPTTGAAGVSVADLDADGHLDLVFAGITNGVTNVLDSYVYYGSALGFSEAARVSLPTVGANDNTIADVNADGFLDIVFSSYMEAADYLLMSYVYLGSAEGFAPARRLELATRGALSTSVADVDADGQLDILFANHFDGTTRATGSFIYRGSADGFVAAPLELPTLGAHGVYVADYDLDGLLDVTVTSFIDDLGAHTQSSLVFRGAEGGPSPSAPIALPTIGAQAGVRRDLGNLYDRSDREEYVSSPIELPSGSATRLSWIAETPHGSSVELSLRSAPDAAGLEAAPWIEYARSFSRVSDVHREHHFFQYRVTFRTPGFVGLPVVHAVTLHYLP